MKENMKITIITITYNSEKTLEDTIQSVAMQQYDDLEYLIIDGGSTDGTLDIVRKYPNVITKWISEPDKGISDAFNKGIRLSTGELIGIINSDDMLAQGALHLIADNINANTDVIYGNCIMFGGQEADYRYKPYPNIDVMREEMAVIHPATFVKKSAYEKYGVFDLKYKCQMDRELLLRMLVNGAKFQYLDADLARMRLGGVNQRTYLSVTIPEGREISVKYGGSPLRAWLVAIKCSMRFRMARFVRRFPFAATVRKLIHSQNTELMD